MNGQIQTALTGARVFDGGTWHSGMAVVLDGTRIGALVAVDALPPVSRAWRWTAGSLRRD